jgi:hypothetical protein
VKARRVQGLDPEGTLADNAERIVLARLDELYAFMPQAADEAEVEALHDMRIAAKRLRYVLDVTRTCFGPYAATAAKRAKELQALLGDIHDCDEHLPTVEALIAELRAEDAVAVRAAAGRAADVDAALAAAAPNADAYDGLVALATYLIARRQVLFARFLLRWNELQREGLRSRLAFAAGERPEPAPAPLPLRALRPEPDLRPALLAPAPAPPSVVAPVSRGGLRAARPLGALRPAVVRGPGNAVSSSETFETDERQ